MWKVRSLLISFPGIILATVAMGSISLACSLWDRTGVSQHRVAQWWSRMLLALGFLKCEAIGLEKLDPAKSYVLVSNHASYMDTPAIMGTIPLEFRFFAKHGLFSIPFLGWHLRHAGHLPVVRDDPRASIKSMAEGAKLIRDRGVSLLLFPEGGRSEVQIQPFKEGAAYIAIKAGVPIVPIGLVGTRVALPMHSTIVRPTTIQLLVGDPIETAGLSLHDRGRLTIDLQERVASLIGEKVGTAPVPTGE